MTQTDFVAGRVRQRFGRSMEGGSCLDGQLKALLEIAGHTQEVEMGFAELH